MNDGFHAMFSVDANLIGLMFSIFHVLVLQSSLLTCDVVHLAGLKLLWWLHWTFDFT